MRESSHPAKKMMRSLLFVVGAALLPAATCALTPKADALMVRRGLPNLEEAATLYSRALEGDKDNVELKLKLAEALNGQMRVRTNSNTITISGLLDTPTNKAIWAKLGPRALELAKAARDARPNDVRAAATYADAYMYACSSKGIISQALAGAGTAFKANAERIIKLDRTYDSGVGYAFLGCFYAIAPWPYGSLDKASANLDAAVKISPSLRNLYYVGVVAYKRKEWAKAVENLSKAELARPGSPTEADFAPFMRTSVVEALTASKIELQRQKAENEAKESKGKGR